MDMKIDVNVTAPEIVDAILILANAVTKVQLKLESLRRGEKMEEVKEIAAADETGNMQTGKQKTGEARITLDELRAVLIAFSREGMQEQVKALINRFGGKKLTDIPEEKYMDMYREVEKWEI